MRKQRKLIRSAFALALTAPSMVFAEVAKPVSIGTPDAPVVAKDWSSEDMTTVNFIKGGSALTEAETLNLKALYQKAARTQAVGRILVLAWSDKDGLKDEAKSSESQISLAQKRADVVKEMLTELSQKPVEAYNMALEKKAGELTDFAAAKGGPQRAIVIFERDKVPGNKAAGR